MAGLFDDIPTSGAGGARQSSLFDDLPDAPKGSFLPEAGKAIAAGAVGGTGTALSGVGGHITALENEQFQIGRRRLGLLDRLDKGEDVIGTEKSLTPDEISLLRDYGSIEDPDVRAQFRKQYEDATAGGPSRVQDSVLHQAGKAVKEFSDETFAAAQDYENSWTRGIGEGLGSLVPVVGGSVLAGPVGGAGVGLAMTSGEAVDRAVKAGASQEDIIKALQLASPVGLTEQIPLELLFERVAPAHWGKLAGALVKIGSQALAEGGQEAVQTAWQNAVEKYVYDPEQDVTEGVIEAAAIGAAVGGVVGGAERGISAVTGRDERELLARRQAATTMEAAGIDRIGLSEAQARSMERPIAPEAVPGDTERLNSPRLTEEDRASPIPNDIIDDGKAILEDIDKGIPVPGVTAPSLEEQVAAATPAEPDQAAIVKEIKRQVPTPLERATLRMAGNLDEDIDQMSPAERRAEFQSALGAGVLPSAQELAAAEKYKIEELAQPAAPPARVEAPAGTMEPLAPEAAPSAALATVRGLDTDANSSRPAAIQTAEQIEAAVARVNTEPTEAQKEAGNYKKAHIKVNGYDIAIETPKGAVRRGRNPDGTEWSVQMPAHYGEIKRTAGADGDAVDVYVGDNPTSKRIYIVDQKAPSERGRFDEHKVIFGANSIEEAKNIYRAGFSDGSGNQRMGAISSISPAAFRRWLADPATSNKPYRYGVIPTNAEGMPVDAMGKVRRPPSMVEFLAQNGGIREDRGELAAMDAQRVFVPGSGPLVRPGGLTLDQARGMLVENGYLNDSEAGELSTSTVDDFLVALREDIATRDQFSVYDEDWASAYRAERYNEEFAAYEQREGEAIYADLQAAGVARPIDDPYVKRIIELVLSERMEIADAAEQAAFEEERAEADIITPHAALELPEDALDAGPAQQGSLGVETAVRGGEAQRPGQGAAPQPPRGEPSDSGEARPGAAGGQGRPGQGQQAVDPFDAAFDAALDEFAPQPTTEAGAEGKPQLVIPGAERIPDKQFAEMQAAKPLRGTKPQKDMPAGGLFDDLTTKQTDIFDQPAKKPEPSEPATARNPNKPIGVNRRGNPVYEDERGVRSYSERGVRISESVQFIPGRGISIDKSQRGSDFKTEEEYAEDRAEAAKAAGATAKAKSAVKNAAMGLDEITKGLSELFGGTKVSSGLSFDEETYAKALPYFRAGIEHFKDAASDVAGMVRALVQHLASSGMSREAIQNMRPYVRRFVEDEQANAAAPAETASNQTEEINTPATDDRILSALVDRLISPDGKFANILEARKFLNERGWKPKNAVETTAKQQEEFIEHAVVRAAREMVKAGKARGEGTVFDRLVGLYDRQPKLGSRTSTSVAEQAYSTPAPLAYVASRLAGIDGSKSVLEPTAGNGMLLIEASPKQADANELNADRADNLAAQGFTVSREDATDRDFSSGGPYDVVIANPPFGAVRSGGESTVFDIDGYRTTAVDQAIAMNALKAMKNDGRAVLIVGSVKEGTEKERSDNYNTSQKRKFYKRLYDNYRVVEHFTVAGDLYSKQGAGWPVDVIVIDGKGKSSLSLPAVRVPKVASTWADVKGYLNAPRTGEGETGLPRPAGTQVPPASSGMPVPAAGRPTGGGQAGSGGTPSQPSRPARPAEPSRPETGGGQSEVGERVGGGPGSRPLEVRPDAGGVRDRTPAAKRDPRLKAEANATGQVPYRPYSRRGTPLNTLVPHALGLSMDESLAAIEQEHGDIDAYVADALGYSLEELPDVFSAEQVDAIALAINNVAKGDAFIIGDQTGIGKGRVVAAAIRYAHRQGMTPVFVTEKPDLYGDMYRDLGDIQWKKALGRDPKIFMTNAGTTVPLDDEAVEWIIERDEAKAAGQKAPPRRGHFSQAQTTAAVEKQMGEILSGKFKPDVVFTTYDQMNTIKGAETSRRRFMDRLSSDAFLIMDESHNAGGQGARANERGKKDAPVPRSAKFREWVAKAKSVMYSSATYAKNPQVMDLYSRTDMAKAVDDPSELPDLIAKGKVPLQQVVASMLAKAGQYARRERSFEGVEYELEEAEVDKESYADFAGSIRAIFEFDRAISEFRKAWIDAWLKENGAGMGMDSGLGDLAANSTEFASIMHNIVNQMLLSIKADTAAQKAIDALERGEKPVIALAFTAESFVTDYAEDQGIDEGGTMNIGFKDVVRRYLERTLRITVKNSDDTKSHVYIPVEELGEFEDMYRAALERVENLILSNMPVSPIDHIRTRIQKAGYKVAEVTGRQTMLVEQGNNLVLASRPSEEQGASGKRATIKKFNDGALDVVILNKSGSTGVSMHASSKFKDKRRRRMILAQADPNIDTHMQMLGRVHRTGQVIPPAYTQLAADIPAEARPTAVLMKKMASLNANTTASRKSAFTTEAVDFMNEYGDQAAVQWAVDNALVNGMMGSPVNFDDKGRPTGENHIQRLTGRIMLLDTDDQQAMLDDLTAAYKAIVAQKEALGENALEAKALDLQAEPVSSTEMKPATGASPFQAAANMEVMRVKSTGRAMKPADVIDKVADKVGQRPSDMSDFARSISELQRHGQRWMQKQIEIMRPEHQKYVQWTVGGLKNAEAKANATTKANEAFSHWRDVMQRAYPGAHVILSGSNGQDMDAIVIDIGQSSSKAKSPTAASAWTVTLAIPDSARQIAVPFSQVKIRRLEEGDSGMAILPPDWGASLRNVGDLFENAAKEGKEERLIATGNILAAFDQLDGKGQIIQFTDANGDVRPGIMMPRGFNMAEWQSERRVGFQDTDQVMRFLTESNGKSVTTKDDIVTVDNTYRGYEFSMPASRAKGGKYYTDSAVRKVYDDWRKQGLNMVATVDANTARRLISAMQSIGGKFVAPGEPDLAQSIVFPKGEAQFQLQGGQRAPSLRAARPREDVRDDGSFLISEQVGNISTVLRLRPQFVEKSRELQAALRRELDRIGLADVALRVPERIDVLLNGDFVGEADGRHLRGVIDVALGADRPVETVHHEAMHAMRKLGLFSDREWGILSRKSKEEWIARYRVAEQYSDIANKEGQIEEGIAQAYGKWAAGEKFDGIIARSFRRIRSFIEALGNALRGLGFTTADQIFVRINRGEMAGRVRGGQGAVGARPDLQPAWHGSPHRFDRFSTEKIGTGEGAQAFGWGLYFASKRGVAQHYRDKLAKDKRGYQTFDGKKITPATLTKLQDSGDSRERGFWNSRDVPKSVRAGKLQDFIEGKMEAERASIRTLQRRIAEYLERPPISSTYTPKDYQERIESHRKQLAMYEKILPRVAFVEGGKGGALFKVEVPEDSELLDWDAPLSEQPEGVREKLEAIQTNAGELLRSGQLERLGKTGQDFYNYLMEDLGGSGIRKDQAASEALRDAGIPGHKFPDGGSRRKVSIINNNNGYWSVYGPTSHASFTSEEAAREEYERLRKLHPETYNYVIYDDSRVSIEAMFQLRRDAQQPAAPLVDRQGIPSVGAVAGALGRRMMNHINRGKRSSETLGDYSHRKLIDYLHPLRRMIEGAGGNVPDTMNAYLQARLAEDAALARMQDMHGQYVMPAIEALANSGATLEDLHRYLYARHAPERNRVVGARNAEDSDFFKAITDHDIKGASGWSTNEAKAVIRELRQDAEKFAGIQEAGRLMRQMLDQNLADQLRAGLISEETYALLTEQWRNYVPLRADDGMDENGNFRPGRGRGFDVRGKEFEAATGRFNEAENIPAWAVSLAERTHLRAEKNNVGKAVLRFLNQYDPEGENLAQVYWSGDKPEDADGIEDIEKAPAVYRRRIGADGKVHNQRVPYSTISPDMFAVKVGGKTFYIKFANDKVGLALKKMGTVDLDALSRLVRKFTGWQSLINTRANPGFVPINIARDAMTGGIHLLDEGFTKAEVSKILKSIPKAWGALWRNARKRPNMQSPYDRALKEYIDAGGKITFEPHKTLEDSIEELRKQMQIASTGQSRPREMWEEFKWLVGSLNDVGENGIRLATYMAQREKGKTVKQAAFSARDLTVDFKKHGEVGPLLNSWFVFFNASAQGSYNIAARLAKSKTVRRAAYTIAASAVLTDLWNRMMSGDDDDEESYYSKLLRTEPWTFERNMVLFFGSGSGDYIKIPLPYGYNAIYNVGTQASAVAHGDVEPLEGLGSIVSVTADAFNPIGSGGSFLNFVVPTIIDPIADIYTNMNFTGRPISPTRYPGQDDPDSQRYFQSTPDWARTLADWMNTATGGDEVVPGVLDVAPDTLEHLWGYVVGGTGRFFGQAFETAKSAIEGDEIEPENVPWVRSFYGKVDEDSQRSDYYTAREEVQTAKNALKSYGEAKKPDAARSYAAGHKAAVASIGAFDAAEKALRKVRKAKRQIDGDDSLSRSEKEAKLKPLEETELKIMKGARAAYAKARKEAKR